MSQYCGTLLLTMERFPDTNDREFLLKTNIINMEEKFTKFTKRAFIVLYCIVSLMLLITTYDALKQLKSEEKLVEVLIHNDTSFMMKPVSEGIYEAMYYYGIREEDLDYVYAQAVLESQVGTRCRGNNLFGITHKGGLVKYDYWFDCVRAYHDEIYYKYDPKKFKDYYDFLTHIPPYNVPYAEAPDYVQKLKVIVAQINNKKYQK